MKPPISYFKFWICSCCTWLKLFLLNLNYSSFHVSLFLSSGAQNIIYCPLYFVHFYFLFFAIVVCYLFLVLCTVCSLHRSWLCCLIHSYEFRVVVAALKILQIQWSGKYQLHRLYEGEKCKPLATTPFKKLAENTKN